MSQGIIGRNRGNPDFISKARKSLSQHPTGGLILSISRVPKLSAHDYRHYCATKMAWLGYGVDELLAWFGWTSAQTAMRYVAAADVQVRYKGYRCL